MSKDSEPQQDQSHEPPASLLDAEARGGPTAIRGFDFQRRYALILLLRSLPDPDWSAILVEGAEDVETRFDRQGRIERRAIQLKNYRVTAAMANEIVGHLKKLDNDSPGTWTGFVIACAEVDDTLKAIHNSLERYRPAGSFYAAENAILANSRADLERQIEAARLPLEFVRDRLTFEPGLQPYKEEEWVRARALDLLHKSYPEIGHATAEEIYLHLKDLVSESTARSIERRQVVAVIDRVRATRAEALLRTAPPPLPDPAVVPEPGSLPTGSRLPFSRNRLFTGRVESLQAVAKALLYEDKAAGEACVVQGLGGVGKTQLAVQFAYCYGRYFQGVHWLSAAQPAALEAEVAACGLKMELEQWPDKLPEQAEQTLRAWRETGPRLVVLDNLEDVAAMGDWLDRLAGETVRLLVTARRRDWPDDLGLTVLPLGVFSAEESRIFLRQYLDEQRAGDAELASLAERLGHLPLALELAGRYLKRQPRLAVAEYAARLEEVLGDPAMKGWRPDLANPTGHDLDLAATFAVSWSQVTDEAARRVFMLAGWCAPKQPIPPEVVQRAAGLDEAGCDEAVGILAGLGLLEWDDPQAGPAIHPLLAEFGRKLDTEGAEREEQGEGALAAVSRALARLSYEVTQTGLPARFAPLRGHVEKAAMSTEEAGLEEAGALWNNLGSYRNLVGDYAGARAAYEQALAIDERAYGPDHPIVAIRVNNLGTVLQDLGDLAGARAALKRALGIWRTVHGEEHPWVATAHNNLGRVLQDLGDLAGARAAYEQALAIDEKVYGPDHPDVARDVNNIGLLLRTLGDLAGARVALERALAIWRTAHGEEHPWVATAHNNLGSVLQNLGDLAGARAAYEQALAIDERAYGPGHPDVARDVNNLGTVLNAVGDLTGARDAFERTLGIWRTAYGEEHPRVATTHTNLASVLQNLGDLAGAKTAYERALAIREKVSGREHPETLATQLFLSDLAAQAGDMEEARGYLEEILRIAEKLLPVEHPFIVELRQKLEGLK